MEKVTLTSVIGLALIIIILLSILLQYPSQFLLNRDSYEILVTKPTERETLGIHGQKITITPYNRSLNVIISETLGDNVFFFRYLQFGIFIFSILILFYLLLLYTGNQSASLIGTTLFGLSAQNIFMLIPVGSDTIGIAFIILSLLFNNLSKTRNRQRLFTLLSLATIIIACCFRIEYIIIFCVTLIYAKRKVIHIISLVSLSLLMHILLQGITNPQASVESLKDLILTLQNELLFFSIIGFVLFIAFLVIRNVRLRTVLLTIMVMAIFFFLILTTQISIYLPFITSILPALLIFGYISFKKQTFILSHPLSRMSLLIISLFFIFYKTLYFQHLIIMLPFISIICAIEITPLFNRAKDLSYKTLGSILGIALISVFTYKLFFAQYTIDFPAYTSNYINQIIIDNSYDKDSTIVYSYAPEAMWFKTAISSRDIGEKSEVPRNVKQIIILNTKRMYLQDKRFSTFTFKETISVPYFTDYSFYEEKLGYNPKVFIHVLVKY